MNYTQRPYNVFFAGTAPIQLKYDGKPISIDGTWQTEARNEEGHMLEKRSFSPDEQLTVTLEIRRYANHPVVEWGLVLQNPSQYTSKLVSDVDIANVHFLFDPLAITPMFVEMAGSNEQLNDFRFLRTQMFHGARRELKCFGGRSTSHTAPYFNMILDGIGYILAIGWSGQWNAKAWRTNDEGYVDFCAGMEDCEFVVQPGERLELPRMLICEWTGKEEDGYNIYRRFALDHIVPKDAAGKPVELINCMSGWGGAGQKENLRNLELIREKQPGPDCYWIDAGWYGDENCVDVNNDHYESSWYRYAGINDWNPNPLIYPDGMKIVSDRCREIGIDFLLWYEPERANSETKRVKDHPDWYIGDPAPGASLMLNLGNDEAREWITRRLSEDIEKYNMRVLRIDFNYPPLSYWRMNDKPNRKGISEIYYNRGLYRMWSELLRRFPNLIIDNCASGGRRLDYEALRYSIPFFRTDYSCFLDSLDEGHQLQTYFLNHYIPVNGTHYPTTQTAATVLDMKRAQPFAGDTYSVRSRMNSGITLGTPAPDASDWVFEWCREMYAQQSRIRRYTYGDYYPLTGATDDPKDWIAWQMHLSETNEGMVMAFRRAESPICMAEFELRGIDRAEAYVIEDLDTGVRKEVSGSELANGFKLELPKKRSSAVLFYTRK